MGLLDDAIRDHLELKRLRGADPGLLDREQREALDPVLRDEEAERAGDLSTAVAGVSPDGETTPVGAAPSGDPHTTPQPARSTDLSDVCQETAELDMRTVLGEREGAPPAPASPEGLAIAGSLPVSPSAGRRDEDSLEWEVPGEPSHTSPADGGRQVPYTQRSSGP